MIINKNKEFIMIIFKLIISCILCLIFVLHSYGQNSNQKYIYKNKTVKIVLSTSKIQFSSNDTVVLNIKIENLSNNKIFLFDNPFFSFIANENNDRYKILINYGSLYKSGYETWQKMIILSPLKSKKFVLKISIDSLLKIGYKDLIYMNLGIGYIENYEKIKEYQHMSTIIPKIEGNSIITLSAVVVDAALTRETLNAFGVNLK
jgi:hypothetical protein